MSGAVFFPARIPETIRANTRRRAECRVYDILQDQLSAPWHVYYSRPWLGLDKDGRDKDGEADFVLAHPELGMLVVEVKGGGIAYDAQTDQWTTTNSDQDKFRIRNPAVQATTSKHELLRKVKRDPRWGSRFINARIGVIFPDCRVTRDLAMNLPRSAVAGVAELPDLGDWMQRRLAGPDDDGSSGSDPIGTDGMTVLDDLFAHSFQLEVPFAATLLQADSELRLLTERQAVVLQYLDHHRRLAIPGAAGTGKTSLATEKARRLASDGKRTLLLCYNRPLAVHLRAALGDRKNLEVANFHSFVAKLARRAKLKPPDTDRDVKQADGAWGNTLLEALGKLPEERFDAIVVDEGQDLDEGWIEGVETLLRDPAEGVLYVFYDDNQKVHGQATSLESHLRKSDVTLNRVLRNTRPIAESYRALLPQGIAIDGPNGPVVEFREISGSATDALLGTLSELIESREIAPGEIAILAPDKSSAERLIVGGRIGIWRVADAESLLPGRLMCDSVRRFKGLERQVVVLLHPSHYCSEVEMLYVGMSRARTLLVLLDDASGLLRVRTCLATSAG